VAFSLEFTQIYMHLLKNASILQLNLSYFSEIIKELFGKMPNFKAQMTSYVSECQYFCLLAF